MKENRWQSADIDIQILKHPSEQRRILTETDIIYVLSGTLEVQTEYGTYGLAKEDVILLNAGSPYGMKGDGSCVVCRVSISYKLLADVIEDGNYTFHCNCADGRVNDYRELRTVMKRIVLSFAGPPRKTGAVRYALVYGLLDCLTEHFQKETDAYGAGKQDGQIQFITSYVNANYRNTIRLEELAGRMCASKSTVSRLFKKQTGIYFAEYVSRVRLDYAVRALLNTRDSITKIAVDCGFSTPSVFSKTFQQAYGMTPSEYRNREQHTQECGGEPQEWDAVRDSLMEEDGYKTDPEEIRIQAGEGQEYRKSWNMILNAGNAYNLSRANLQYHILYLAEQLGFRYVRIWNLFSRKMMVRKKEGDYNYNFDMVDTMLDFLVEHNLKVFIDFGKRPETAVSDEQKMVYYEEDYIDFQGQGEWENLFHAFLRHIISRYGKEEAGQWIYEFTEDMRRDRGYFTDGKETLDSLFVSCHRIIRTYLPQARIGGISQAVMEGNDRIAQWLSYCADKGCTPDFISVVVFPYRQMEEDGTEFARRLMDDTQVFRQLEQFQARLALMGFGSVPLYITEWNQSVSNRNYLNDSCFRAAYAVRMVNACWNKADMMGIWMGSDWVSSYYDTARIANGGSGIITKDNIRKPVFYALQFLNRLGNRFLKKGSGYIATTDGIRSFYILCYHFKHYSPCYFLQSEDSLDVRRLPELFEDDNPLDMDIKLEGMPEDQIYSIKKYSVSPHNGSILNAWGRFQFEKELDRKDIKYLDEISLPGLTMERRQVKKGILEVQTVLEAHETALLHIYQR